MSAIETLAGITFVVAAVTGAAGYGISSIERADSETFRRFCMSYDAWIVGFGLSRVFIVLQPPATPVAYAVWLCVAAIDAYLLYVYFRRIQTITVNAAG